MFYLNKLSNAFDGDNVCSLIFVPNAVKLTLRKFVKVQYKILVIYILHLCRLSGQELGIFLPRHGGD